MVIMANAEMQPFEKNKGTKNNCIPPALALLTDKDWTKFLSALDVDPNPKSQMYGKSFMCVHSVLTPSEEAAAGKRFDLKALLTPPLWTLSRNLGIANCGSKNKFECRRAMIAAIFSYQEKLETNGLGPRSHAGDLTSTICRAVSVVLSNQFIESFKTVNDTKTRRDHETNSTNKHFGLMQHWHKMIVAVVTESHCLPILPPPLLLLPTKTTPQHTPVLIRMLLLLVATTTKLTVIARMHQLMISAALHLIPLNLILF
jgi:hypothetical protein